MIAEDIPKLLTPGERLQAFELKERANESNPRAVRASIQEALRRQLIDKVTEEESKRVYYCLPESVFSRRVLPPYPRFFLHGDISGQPDPFRERMKICMLINRSM